METQNKRELTVHSLRACTVIHIGEFSFTLIPLHDGIILKDASEDENSVTFFRKDSDSDIPYHPEEIYQFFLSDWDLGRDTAELWTRGFFWGLEQLGYMEG